MKMNQICNGSRNYLAIVIKAIDFSQHLQTMKIEELAARKTWHNKKVYKEFQNNYLHLGNNSVHDTPWVARGTSSWSKGIEFIKEDDTGPSRPSLQSCTVRTLWCNEISLKILCIQPEQNRVKEKLYTFWKISRIFFSDSPMYMLINSGPFTLRKLREHSVATAFANKVWHITGLSLIFNWWTGLLEHCLTNTYFTGTWRTIQKNTRTFTQPRWE